MNTITITRQKHYNRGSNYRVAWVWHYNIHVPGEKYPNHGMGTGLANTRRWAKAKAKELGFNVVEQF